MGAIKVALVFDSDELSTSGFGTYTISGRADSVDFGGEGWLTTSSGAPPASLVGDEGLLQITFETLVNHAQSTYDSVNVTPELQLESSGLFFVSLFFGTTFTNALLVRGFDASSPPNKVWQIGNGSPTEGITGDFKITSSKDLGSLSSVAQLNIQMGTAVAGGFNTDLTAVVVPEGDAYVLILTCLLLAATVGRHTLRRVFTNH